MTKRSVNTSIEEVLVSNEAFEYAHLIKFERPFKKDPDSPDFRTNANRYAYFTDASRDISFNDASTDQDGNSNGSQVYRANRVKSIGSYSETTSPRATNMALTLSGNHLGTSISISGDFGSSAFTVDTTFHDDRDATDLVDFGFREGDKVKITKNSGTFSTGVTSVTYVITGFASDNRKMTFATTGNDSDDTTTYPTDTSVSVTISLESEEVRAMLNDKATLELANPSFLNREVFIHKVFIDPETGDIQGNSSILIFKGIIGGCSIKEAPNGSDVKWNLTSHWGDWSQVGGRLTTDDNHRALDGSGKPTPSMTIKPEYADDLGFIHSETTLSAIANYKTYETETVYKNKRMGGLGGLFGLKKTTSKEIQKEVDNEVDLSVGLQGKYLPLVYGVQRIPGIPVFADTDNSDSKVVFIADAICEGEIHGVYNLYIDGVPLICTDEADYDVRGESSTSTDAAGNLKRDSAQLQCYGRADRGDTLGGVTDSTNRTAANNYFADSKEITPVNWDPREVKIIMQGGHVSAVWSYENIVKDDIPTITAQVADAQGLQHQEHGSISHPHDMGFTFYKGTNSQLASNLLVTQAEGTGFKRQKDYYTSDTPYWSPNHRLLDTAYMVNVFTISADSTEIPEVEYVVRGKLIECYNFDNSYVPDAVLGASDDHTDFNEGDTVTVERSTDGSSYSGTTVEGDATDSSFRILHKYLFTESNGNTHYRFLLDQTPDLDAVNGLPAKTFLRLKKTGATDYWHMRTFNHRNVEDKSFELYAKSPTAVGVNGDNEIQLTFSASSPNNVSLLKAGYETELASGGPAGKAIYSVVINDCTALSGLQDIQAVGTWSGSVLTLKGIKYVAADHGDTAIADVTNVLNIGIYKSRNFYMNGGSGGPFEGFDNNADFTGATITLNHTGESRRITSYTQSEKRIEIESPFKTLTEADYDAGRVKFDISGTSGDRRAVTNTALQLLDYMEDPRYGKDLDVNNDVDLASFIASAKLCEVRGTLTLGVTSTTNVTVGDYYKLADASSNHLGSARVSSVSADDYTVTFDQLSGKFLRLYGKHIAYADDEYIVTNEGNLYQKSTAGYLSTKPTHTTGTANGCDYISAGTFTLAKESGSGPSTITIAAVGEKAIAPTYSLYDSDFVKYWRYMGWEHHKQCFVTRHQTNFNIDTSKSIFENMNVFLSHMNGMLSYEAGKYVLDIETQADAPTSSNTFNSVTYNWNVNPEYIDNTDIIGSISLTDNSSKKGKNTIKASIIDPANNWSSRSVSFFNSNFLEADRKVVKTGNFNYTGITNYYNARMGTEKELIQSRFSREISFKVGPKGLLLKAGQVIALTYEPFGFSSKLFRIANLNFNPDCSVSVKALEYDDSQYIISAVRANELRQEAATQSQNLSAPGAPTSLAASTTKPGSVILTWNNATTFVNQSDDIEVWASDDNNRSNATLLTVLDDETNFTYTTAGAGTKFYWVRTRRLTNQLKGRKLLTSAYHPTSATGGVTGTSKLLSPNLSFDITNVILNFDSGGNLDPSGTGQDTTLNVIKQNLSGTPTIQILDASDQGTQSDVLFTNGSASITANAGTIDASTASSSSTAKIVKATLTESGETFNAYCTVSIIQQGAAGAGKQKVVSFVYHQASASSQPSTPSATSYNISNNSFSGLTSGWATTPPTFAAGNANKYWYSYFTAEENTAGGGTSSANNLVFQPAQQGIGFSGLVTFSSGNLVDGSSTYNPATIINANSTTIDGGKITTNSITANQIAANAISLTGDEVTGTLAAGNGGTGLTSITTLTNSGISISSAGVLSGAGGGAVTASGLGANTDSTSTIQGGVTLGNISGTTLSAGKIKLTSSTFSLDTSSTISSNAILIEANSSSGARIIIAD